MTKILRQVGKFKIVTSDKSLINIKENNKFCSKAICEQCNFYIKDTETRRIGFWFCKLNPLENNALTSRSFVKKTIYGLLSENHELPNKCNMSLEQNMLKNLI